MALVSMSQRGGLDEDALERMVVSVRVPEKIEDRLRIGVPVTKWPARVTMKIDRALEGLEDVPWNAGHDAFCVSQRMADWLAKVCPGQYELHPIHRIINATGKPADCPPYHVVNWTNVIDCLDEEATVWGSTPAVPGVRWARSPVIRLSRVPDSAMVFRTAQAETRLYARQEFADMFFKAGFKGPQFDEIFAQWVP